MVTGVQRSPALLLGLESQKTKRYPLDGFRYSSVFTSVTDRLDAFVPFA